MVLVRRPVTDTADEQYWCPKGSTYATRKPADEQYWCPKGSTYATRTHCDASLAQHPILT